MKKFAFTLSLILTTFSYGQDYQVYQIQEGDNISELLQSRVSDQLYGQDAQVIKNLKLNRINQAGAKKLEIGSYIMLPKRKFISDSIAVSQAASSKVGFLTTKISSHQKVEFNFKFSKKEMNFNQAGNVLINKNYDLGLKIIGNSSHKPTIGFNISNSGSVQFEKNEDLLVDMKPGFELFSQINLIKINRVHLGALFSINEESNIDYINDDFLLRRDQHLWLGAQASTVFGFTSFELELLGNTKKNIVSNNLENYETLNLYQTHIELKMNLTRDYFISSFYDFEAGARTSNSLGLNFIYQL